MVRFFEARFYRRDVKIICAAANARVILNELDQTVFYEGSLEDIAARRKAERSLRESEARKSAILDSVLEAIVTLNHRGQITEFNPAAEKAIGRRREDVVGKE